METRWFWFTEDLTDPKTDIVPLGVFRDEEWTWAPGEPKSRGILTDYAIAAIPRLISEGVRFDSPYGNIFEGECWIPPQKTMLGESDEVSD